MAEDSNEILLPVHTQACRFDTLRLGSPGDGGWNVCDLFKSGEKCIVYSFGILHDYSFDDAAEGRGCSVYGFDPSVRLESKYNSQNKKFLHLGVGKSGVFGPGKVLFRWPGIGFLAEKNTEAWELISISDARSKLRHNEEKIKILKLDVEGAEWFAFQHMLETGILVSGIIEQLVVEIHFDPAKYTLQPSAEQIRVIRKIPDDMNYLALLKGLEAAGMVIWKWQPNGDACIEVSYINTNAFSSGGPVLPFDTFSLASKTSAGKLDKGTADSPKGVQKTRSRSNDSPPRSAEDELDRPSSLRGRSDKKSKKLRRESQESTDTSIDAAAAFDDGSSSSRREARRRKSLKGGQKKRSRRDDDNEYFKRASDGESGDGGSASDASRDRREKMNGRRPRETNQDDEGISSGDGGRHGATRKRSESGKKSGGRRSKVSKKKDDDNN